MKHKTLKIIIGVMILLIGIVAANSLSNLEGINIPLNVIAGDTFQANFSFDYLTIPDNEDNSPLIIKLIMESENQQDYPVWKSDFEINGYVEKCFYTILKTCIFPSTVYFGCSEQTPLTIEHTIGSETINSILDGTFYCYNESADLNLDEHDDVFLNIKSHPALWPGQYNLTARFYYLNDTYPPIVNITNKDAFDKYYRELDNIEIHAEINEVNLEDYWGTIFADENITVPGSHESKNIYHFTKILPIDIPEGAYELKIFAEDSNGLVGTDNTTLKIDRTGPNVKLVEPVGGIFSGIIPIKFNVTDEKAGVDNESVQARLREIKEGIGLCPETGGLINGTGCITTSWINLTLTNGLFEVDVNTTEYNLTSGSYWLEARAEDILGNKAEWIA